MIKNRVRETCTTTGTSDFGLLGAVPAYRTFLAAFGDGQICYYTAVHLSANEYEIGKGTISGATLIRTTVLQSSTGSKIDFTAGTKAVFCAIPSELFPTTPTADLVPRADAAGHIDAGWLKPTIGVDYLYELVDGATINLDLDLASKFVVTLGGNRTLAFTNTDSRNVFVVTIRQDATGGRSVTWPTVSWQTGFSLNAAPNAITTFVLAKTGVSEYIGWRVDTRSNAFYTATTALNAENGLNQKYTMVANTTFTYNNIRDGETLRLVVVQGAGAYTITWPTTSWPSASTPTFTTTNGRADMVDITRVGSTYVGRLIASNFVP